MSPLQLPLPPTSLPPPPPLPTLPLPLPLLAPGFFVISSERSKEITAESPSFLFCFRTAVTMHDRVVIFYGIHDATPWRGISLHGVASAATAVRRGIFHGMASAAWIPGYRGMTMTSLLIFTL
jgi:hypothetical protein